MKILDQSYESESFGELHGDATHVFKCINLALVEADNLSIWETCIIIHSFGYNIFYYAQKIVFYFKQTLKINEKKKS
jgi:hypothetical protein